MTKTPHALGRDGRAAAPSPAPARGFTVTELLVVIAIIAVVIGLVFVAFPKITAAAKVSQCSANQRAIALASAAYAVDNKGRLVSPRTDPDAQKYDRATGTCSAWMPPFPQAESYRHYWVAAFNTSALPNHNANIVDCKETLAALRNGALWNHTGNANVYRSPFDPTSRVRSYSINAFVGVSLHDDRCFPNIAAQYRHDTTTASRIPQPSKTLYTVGEWDRFDLSQCRNWNFNGFMVHPDPDSRYWFDIPATWNPDIVISFVDGSTGTVPLRNRALLDADADGHDFVEPAPALDFHEFRRMLLPGLIN